MIIVVAALEFVDFVTYFDETDPIAFLEKINVFANQKQNNKAANPALIIIIALKGFSFFSLGVSRISCIDKPLVITNTSFTAF